LYSSGFGRGPLDRRAHAKLVVDNHVHDRQLPQRGQVQCLVERPNVRGAVAEQAHHHLRVRTGCAVDGQRQRGPGGRGDLSSDDAVPAEQPRSRVEQVHRPAAAPRHPGGLAEQLGHDAAGFQSPSEGVAVVPVAGEQVIALLQRSH
jgi:hypothetical protein